MFIFLVLIVGIVVSTCKTQCNTGTAIFFNKEIDTNCWTKEELAKLRARKIFNQIIPEHTLPDDINVTFLKNILRCYRRALREVDKQHIPLATAVLRDALADTIGGYLRSDVLPAARLAYYAGYVPYKPVRELHDFYDEIKMNLNTAGEGWKKPPKIPQIANITVVKITLGPGKLFNPCKRLIIKRDSNACLQLPIPRVDDEVEPTAVVLPFKNGGLVSLLTASSENALLKYYTTAARCILRRSPATCRHSDIVNFNNDLWSWMKNEVSPHLMDEKLYAGYGGVLRIAAAVQNYGKVLSRRNLFEYYKKSDLFPWGSWRMLTEPYLFIDVDATPYLYIAFVVLAAGAICFLQMCYNYVLNNDNVCACGGRKAGTIFSYRNERQCHACCSSNEIKCLSKTPVKTERVYECNENLLDVDLSDAEDDCGSSDCHSRYTVENEHCRATSPVTRSTSPPKIETSIEQLKIDKGRVRLKMRQKSEWTEGSSSGSDSAGTGSSTSRPRDLAWARCVVDSALSPRPRCRPRSRSSLHRDSDSRTTTSRR